MPELLVLGGERIAALRKRTNEMIEPATAAPMAQVGEAGPEDALRRAVEATNLAVEGAHSR